MSITTIFANPGKTVTLAVQVVDGYGVRADGYQAPTIDFIRLPNGSNAVGYPLNMTQLASGLYIHSLVLPSGSSAVGTYLVSASWPHPDNARFQSQVFLINVALPFGNSSAAPA